MARLEYRSALVRKAALLAVGALCGKLSLLPKPDSELSDLNDQV